MVVSNVIGNDNTDNLKFFEIIESSTNFTAPLAGRYLVIAQAGGGSGSARYNSVGTAWANGGRSGDTEDKIVTLEASEVVSISIGAGGPSVSSSTLGESLSGNDGGNTTFGAYITVIGGVGGTVTSTKTETKRKFNSGVYTDGVHATGNDNYGGGGEPSITADGGDGAASSQGVSASSGDLGSGGGGVYSYNGTITSGPGGNGFIMIKYLGE